jgi:hypothetical protein
MQTLAFSAFLYRERNLVDRFVNKLKHFRAVAARGASARPRRSARQASCAEIGAAPSCDREVFARRHADPVPATCKWFAATPQPPRPRPSPASLT